METGEEFCVWRGLHFTCSVICLLVRYDHGILQKFCTFGSTLRENGKKWRLSVLFFSHPQKICEKICAHFFVMVRQIFPFFWGGGDPTWQIVSLRQNMNICYFAHHPKIPSRTDKLDTIFSKTLSNRVFLKILGATPQLVSNFTPIRKLLGTF